ncbi:MAG: hypothetical protein HC813_00525 [Planctomycetes bacterium]|nr:hypothetical protein [Planctomycetota bacterium]
MPRIGSLPVLLLLLASCAGPRRDSPGERPLSAFYDRKGEPEAEGGRTVLVRPFYSKREDERGKRVDILGPLVRYRSDDVYRRLQIFPNLFYSARHSPADQKSWWLIFFPFLFAGHDDFVLLPFGGVSRGLLGYSHFLMVTPLYLRTRQISSHPTDPVTYTVHHLLWPFLSFGSDGVEGGRRKFRIAPFYGRTVERAGATAGFVLWPFYSWRRSEQERAFFVFPFYGRSERATSRRTTILFPFYVREEDFLTGAVDTQLWPFWRRARGTEGFEARRLWPFASFQRAGSSTEEFVAWPFWRRAYIDDGRDFARYLWLTPFYRHVQRYDRRTGSYHEKKALWPLYRNEHHRDGTHEVSVPHLLPVDAPAIQEMIEPSRPLLSLYHTRIRPDGDRETSASSAPTWPGGKGPIARYASSGG